MEQNKIIIYEVVRIINKKVLFFDEHIERIQKSAEIVGKLLFLTKSEIKKKINELIETSQREIGNIKFIFEFHENEKKQTFDAFFITHKYPTKRDYELGVSTDLLYAERNSPNAKIENQNIRQIADDLIAEKKIYEAILVNPKNQITEGSRSNIFFIKENTVYTAPLENVLGGITRQKVIEICNEERIKLLETEINQTDLPNFNAAFITGTSPQILPILKIGEVYFDVKNQILSSIIQSFDNKVKTEINQ